MLFQWKSEKWLEMVRSGLENFGVPSSDSSVGIGGMAWMFGFVMCPVAEC